MVYEISFIISIITLSIIISVIDMKPAMEKIKAPKGTELSCKGWIQEAALRMLMNNLDPEVAEDPERLICIRWFRQSGA